jgi:hypothetical protein
VHRIAISGLVALATVLGGAAVPAVAMAQPTASARPASAARPTATGLTDPGVPKISCVTATDCLGIEGSSSVSTGGTATPAAIARWNGSSWKKLGVTLPKGTRSVDLNGVSCKAAGNCLVVGDYYTSTSSSALSYPLALSYNGTSLKPTSAVPLPKGASDDALGGVSCTTAKNCVAVGTANGDTPAYGESGTATILETWNGSKWTLYTVPPSAGTAEDSVVGISCATSAFCVLSGTSFAMSGTTAVFGVYLGSWNGKKLTTMKPAAVGGSKSLVLPTEVSCGTPSNCAVVGLVASGDSSSTVSVTPLTEVWNGKAWQKATVTWPKGTAESELLGVSCYAARGCEAVGLAGPKTGPGAAAVAFNGTSAAIQPVPAPAKGKATAFGDVSCLSANSCVAIGETGTAAGSSGALMTGVRNGNAWKLDPGF